MNNKKILGKFVVGSRLHNLNKPDSDFDYRGVHISPLVDILSPYRKNKNTVWIEGNEDNTSYELIDFCKFATQGNPTVLEVLFSNQVKEITPEMEELRSNRVKFLDSTRIFEAVKGYAHNQYNKMNLFEPDKRTPKFAVAYLRTLWQGAIFLGTGELPVQITGEMRDFLFKVKYYDFNKFFEVAPELAKRFAESQVKLAEAYQKNHDKFKPDLEWIENFIVKTYA
jgi:predicted nucleotidyltransferase